MGPLPNKEIEAQIIRVLSENPYGLNIKEVSEKANTTIITAKKHLTRLVSNQKLQEVYHRKMRLFVIQGNKGCEDSIDRKPGAAPTTSGNADTSARGHQHAERHPASS